MTILEENVKKYYQSGYNCSETLLHACNETYQLDISEEDMKMMAGFGGGISLVSEKRSKKGKVAGERYTLCQFSVREAECGWLLVSGLFHDRRASVYE